MTYDMLRPGLEMYSSAPINGQAAADRGWLTKLNRGEWNMLGIVARWGHNTLLIALALMTCVLFFAFK